MIFNFLLAMAMIVLIAPLVASSPLARSTMLLPRYLVIDHGVKAAGKK